MPRLDMTETILVTGGAGFIGSAVVRTVMASTPYAVVNVDKLTYSGSVENVEAVADDARYTFAQADICDAGAVRAVLSDLCPRAIIHLAAESHVDRSIDGPRPFVETNIFGTYVLLEEARRYVEALASADRRDFRFVHVSTDEVFGSLGSAGAFDEGTPYDPSSPYSASKASADHLARAWHRTFGLPVIVTNCSNNYGPYQYPEKLIPVTILNLLAGSEAPVYGTGQNVRDWLFVDDHARALVMVMEKGQPGRTYAIGASNERTNLEIVQQICRIMDEERPAGDGSRHADRIRLVSDRPGHDYRYAIDAARIRTELGWSPAYRHDEALRQTVRWYLAHQDWCQRRLSASGANHGVPKRIGLG